MLDVMSLWLKTMFVAVVLYGYLCLSGDLCLDTIHCLCPYMLLAMRKPLNFCIIVDVIMYCEQ